MTTLVPIGEFARLTHLSVKTLRHYHESGVLEPTEVDSLTGYRRYDIAQLPEAHLVRRLRALDLPLSEVRDALRAQDEVTRNAIVLRHLDRLEQQLSQTHAAVQSLRALLSDPGSNVNVTYRHEAATRAVSIRGRTDRDGIDAWCAEVFPELYGALATAGFLPTGPGGALYPSNWFENDEGEVVAFVPLDEIAAKQGRVEAFVVPASSLAVAIHAGPFHDLDRTYSTLGASVTENGLGIDGPIRERYLVSPADDPDPVALRTEVCWPISKQLQQGAELV